MIGTNSAGLPLDDAIASMLRAAVQANRLLAGPTYNADRIIDSLQFIELYEDLAVKAQQILQAIAGNLEFQSHVRTEALVQSGDAGTRASPTRKTWPGGKDCALSLRLMAASSSQH